MGDPEASSTLLFLIVIIPLPTYDITPKLTDFPSLIKFVDYWPKKGF